MTFNSVKAIHQQDLTKSRIFNHKNRLQVSSVLKSNESWKMPDLNYFGRTEIFEYLDTFILSFTHTVNF